MPPRFAPQLPGGWVLISGAMRKSAGMSRGFSIIVGTGTGLVVKYLLDKRFIFRFKPQNVSHDSRTFVLYTLMGVVTTAIFWGFEYGFWHAFGTAQMRYLGGVIGLVIGYLAKYHLDKKFVFGISTSQHP